MARLFVSYARVDGRDFADQLCRDLEARGHDPWLDRSDLQGGTSWTESIERAIDGCDALMAVLTAAYCRSRVCGYELARAHRKEKRLIPLRLASGVDPPLLLETAQAIDFSEPSRYDAGLASLLADLSAAPAPAAPSPPADAWAAVRRAAAAQSARFVGEKQGSAGNAGVYVPDLLVPRPGMDQVLAGLLAGDRPGLILVGDGGVGKTVVACQWVQALTAQGVAVLAYDGGALPEPDLEREVARDLGLAAAALLAGLDDLDRCRAPGAPPLVIVLDAVNAYQGSEREGVQLLLKRLNGLVARVPAASVRIVVTCSTATWTRLDRLGPLRLDWTRYFEAATGEPIVRLGPFDAAEVAAAYARYARYFDLTTPADALTPELTEHLRNPALMRMTTEACRGRALAAVGLARRVSERFIDARVRTPAETLFVDELADGLIEHGATTLPLSSLARHERLGPAILSDEADSTYQRLLERGVLLESHANAGPGLAVGFAQSRIAAVVLARRLLASGAPVTETAAALVTRAGTFPLAWDTARTALLLTGDDQALITLAEGLDPECRELAAEALVERADDEPAQVRGLLERLLDRPSAQARRTALRAAYAIGPATRPVLMRAAIEGSPDLRQAVRDTLYVIWRHESPLERQRTADALYLLWRASSGFTYEFLDELTTRISLSNLPHLPAILEFVVDLSVTIYVNHCERPEVRDRTAALYKTLATRLHLDLLNTGMLGEGFERLVFRAVARAFSEHILDWMLFGAPASSGSVFDLPASERARLSRLAAALDPAATLATCREDLTAMLSSTQPVFGGTAAFALAVHACRDVDRVEPLIRELFAAGSPRARQWLLLAFAVLQPDTPPAWTPLVAWLTERVVTDDPQWFRAGPDGVLADFDIVLVPLGLAYGKAGDGLPLIDALITRAVSANDLAAAARLMAALGPVGFYYPTAVLELLERLRTSTPRAAPLEEALVSALATMRTLHVDAVDRCLTRLDASEALRRRVESAADVDRVHRYIHVLGHYNNAVHYTVHYPKMRRPLAQGALTLMAEARDAQQFVADYTASAVRLFRAAHFDLLEWTRPE